MIDIIDGVNDVHLTWEVEQLPNNADHNVDDQSKSTASSFHNIEIDDAGTDSEIMPLLVPRTSDSDSENEPDTPTDDVTSNDDNCSYYKSITEDPDDTECVVEHSHHHNDDSPTIADLPVSMPFVPSLACVINSLS